MPRQKSQIERCFPNFRTDASNHSETAGVDLHVGLHGSLIDMSSKRVERIFSPSILRKRHSAGEAKIDAYPLPTACQALEARKATAQRAPRKIILFLDGRSCRAYL